MTIYRVIEKRTASLQPGSATTWTDTVIYIGPDRDAARIAYHASDVDDHWRGYGNSSRPTVVETIDDAGTADFADDTVLALD